jgi:CHASE2 domain-containing sensor protein
MRSGSWSKVGSRIRLWRERHRILYDIAVGVMLGLLVEIVVGVALRDAHFVRIVEDWIGDETMDLAERTDTGTIDALPFVFVNVDDESWARWGFPLITPRDRLADVIKAVYAAAPAAIIFDYDLVWPSPDVAADDALRGVLQSYPTGGPPLVLVRSLLPSRQKGQYPGLRKTPFDDTASQHPNIHWATARFSRDDDGVARRWRLYETICDDDANPDVLPSVELAAVAALKGSEKQLTFALKQLIPGSCDASDGTNAEITVNGGRSVMLPGDRKERRLIYSIRWQLDEPYLGPWTSFRGRNTPLVAVLSAARVLDAAKAGDTIAIASGRVVVLGNSFRQDNDYRRTPIGSMPGAMVVINAVHSLLQHGSTTEPSIWTRIAIGLGLVIFNAVAFLFLRLFLAVLVGFLVITVVLVVTLQWLQSGSVLDVTAPSIGVLAHRMFVITEEGLRLVRSRGLRALLRDGPNERGADNDVPS